MSNKIHRNVVVALLGTPDRTEGSLNDPRQKIENGTTFNEKWIYEHLPRDPAGVPIRTIYWWRYDFMGTVVRARADEPWRPDSTLEMAVENANARLAEKGFGAHPPLTSRTEYRPASDFDGLPDLGGHRVGDPKLY
jgi:hypothetical protein